MQPVTVALSPTGIEYLVKSLVGDQIAKALETNLTTPGYGFTMPNFNNLPSGSSIENDYSNIAISLSSGTFKTFTPVFQAFAQGMSSPNQFTITINALNIEIDFNWNESYTLQQFTWNRGGMKVPYSQPSNPSSNFGYSISIPIMMINAVFSLSIVGGAYVLTFVSSTADPGNPQPNIPSGSILNLPNTGDCGFSTKVAQATVQQLDNINYGACVTTVLKPIFASISQSGQLGPVTFDFLAPGDSGLAFPAVGGGIQIGAKGAVSVNGTPFPATAPADLALPPIPTGNPAAHATYFVQDYEFDALCWGFFEAGQLHTTLTAGEITDPKALETDTYSDTSLRVLTMHYPHHFMTAGLTAQAAPTVQFTNVYQVSPDSMAKVQAAVGPTVWTQYGAELSELTAGLYSNQTGFESYLTAIDPKLMTYAATIEPCLLVPGILATLTVRCVLNVIVETTPTPVITFDIAQTFAMQSLQLGVSSASKAQSVTFNFNQPLDINPTPTFVSSTLPGIDSANFGDVWNALASNWNDVLDAIGAAGMPLPRIPGFEFVFDQSSITVQPNTSTADGYLAITTNVSYAPEALDPAVKRATSAHPQ